MTNQNTAQGTFFDGSVSSDDLHGLSRVPFVGSRVDVFSRFSFRASLFVDGFKLCLMCVYILMIISIFVNDM